ncbi:uncharacterized protein LOC119573137 [Penaeus monodon]|uniref:uncharacterized protein LOC119573137 n=1 Tax=Penaeus monodon TaxID=6687 RepID=UPI0018A749C0|nr:uncharacterized protein LOC119573137 [Penaeus monodon]
MQSYILVVVGLYNEKCSFLSPECAKEMAGVGGRRCERKVRPWQYLGKIPWVLSRARRDLDEVGAHRRLSPRPENDTFCEDSDLLPGRIRVSAEPRPPPSHSTLNRVL